ncbi:MAG: polyhydroxyalkanoic acid system family protein [Thermodesulfobacteriota bacterium]
MTKLNMAVSHSLTQDEAGKRVKNLLTDVKTEFADNIKNLHEKWDGNVCNFSFSVMSFPVSGTLTVETSQVNLSGNLPFAAMLFKSQIESTIKDHATTLLA